MEAVEKGKTKLDEFIDAVVNSGKSADELLQEGGLLKELFTRVADRAQVILGVEACNVPDGVAVQSPSNVQSASG